MCDVGFEVGWQVDNIDSAEWAFLWANSTSDTKTFRDEGNFRFGCNFDAKTSTSHNWTRLLAFLSTFLWFALVCADNSDTSKLVGHLC